jgi:rubrerythrin
VSRPPKQNASLEHLLDYARAMEMEAARRYAQLSDMMAQHNNAELAELFRRMADIEWGHVYHVGEIRRELSVPEAAPPLRVALDLDGSEAISPLDMHYLLRPYHALQLAREHEERAARFYSELAASADDEEVRTTALRFAAEEEAHVRELRRWLARYPEPERDWYEDPDPPNEMD